MFRFVLPALIVLSLAAVTGVRAGSRPLFPGVQYAAGWEPLSVAIGDLDGDQVPDLAVANEWSSTVSVLLGVGDGTFATRVHYATGNGPVSVAIGDLNGDQVPDLAVANRNDDRVSVLLGVGDGTFAASVNYPVGDGASSVAIGDLDTATKCPTWPWRTPAATTSRRCWGSATGHLPPRCTTPPATGLNP